MVVSMASLAETNSMLSPSSSASSCKKCLVLLGDAVERPDEHNIKLPLAGIRHQRIKAGRRAFTPEEQRSQ